MIECDYMCRCRTPVIKQSDMPSCMFSSTYEGAGIDSRGVKSMFGSSKELLMIFPSRGVEIVALDSRIDFYTQSYC